MVSQRTIIPMISRRALKVAAALVGAATLGGCGGGFTECTCDPSMFDVVSADAVDAQFSPGAVYHYPGACRNDDLARGCHTASYPPGATPGPLVPPDLAV